MRSRRGRLIGLTALFLLFLLGLFPRVTSAHDNVSIAFTDISMKGHAIQVILQMDMYDIRVEATPEEPDVGDLTPEAYARFVNELQAPVEKYLLANLQLYADDLPLKGKLTRLSQVEIKDQNQPFAEAVLEFPVANTPHKFEMDYDMVFQRDPYHVNYVNAALGELKANAVFVAESHEMRIGDMSAPYTLEHFSLLGLKQALSLFEAILFIALLIIGRRSFKQLAIALAVFWGAYTLTFVLAGLRPLDLSGAFLPFMLAFSVVIVALYTLRGKQKTLYPWLAGGFGLFYGAGYAEGLAGLKADGGTNIVPVLAYMAGIGVALAVIAALLYLLLQYAWKAKSFVPRMSKVILPFAIVWLVVKLFVY
ncbi:HupE/UreJ family protein [Paenibacillus sp. MWE-103]|uniref:HupE/UreJ family protein n=1 Tax=Paenibacillus artemisiicola TaxID=1172618 RepID=A0ABS3W9N8_9BACL|nr:HupE/UreJ family protein [Paenibacillus artemisiicola]MBO7745051.1 HupE/UreJ family protein [Paenibacillus artemisiicola]